MGKPDDELNESLARVLAGQHSISTMPGGTVMKKRVELVSKKTNSPLVVRARSVHVLLTELVAVAQMLG